MVRAVVRRGRRDGLFDGGRRLQGRLPSDVVRRVVRRVCGRHFLDRRALLQRRLALDNGMLSRPLQLQLQRGDLRVLFQLRGPQFAAMLGLLFGERLDLAMDQLEMLRLELVRVLGVPTC